MPWQVRGQAAGRGPPPRAGGHPGGQARQRHDAALQRLEDGEGGLEGGHPGVPRQGVMGQSLEYTNHTIQTRPSKIQGQMNHLSTVIGQQ